MAAIFGGATPWAVECLRFCTARKIVDAVILVKIVDAVILVVFPGAPIVVAEVIVRRGASTFVLFYAITCGAWGGVAVHRRRRW